MGARSVDDGAAALLDAVMQQHRHIRACCIQWRASHLPTQAASRLIGTLVTLPAGTTLRQPLVLLGWLESSGAPPPDTPWPPTPPCATSHSGRVPPTELSRS